MGGPHGDTDQVVTQSRQAASRAGPASGSHDDFIGDPFSHL